MEDGVYTMWNKDSPSPVADGKAPGKNMYGTHPFYMSQYTRSGDNSRAFMGVFNQNAAGQDWYIKNDKDNGKVTVQNVLTGGQIDQFFFMAETPEAVVKQYHALVGNATLVPFWSLGWNQCRWGYRNATMLQHVYENYTKFDFPLDVMWSDIDWMNFYRDFDNDPANFKNLSDVVDLFHKNNRKYVPILDAGLAYRPGGDYKPFNDGVNFNGRSAYL